MRCWNILLSFVLVAPVAIAAPAQVPSTPAAPQSTADVAQLAPVVVTGVVPGPGLWKVSRGGHVLWVLGTLSPLPAHIRWESREVAQALAQSKQLLLEPRLELGLGDDFIDRRYLLPYGARMNPDHRVLRQLVDAPTYARWQTLKKRYIGGDYHVEHWRPLYAAQDLYAKALKAHDLSADGSVPGMVAAWAKQDGVAQTPVEYRVTVQRPRAAFKAFWAAAPDDVECFRHTLDAVEHDLPAITVRANAWSTGDLETLRSLPRSHRLEACVDAISSSGFARRLGIADTSAQLEAAWLAAARQALADNASSFALLPMDELLSPAGYLSRLKAQGYTVEAPAGLDAAPAAAGSTAPAPAGSAAAH